MKYLSDEQPPQSLDLEVSEYLRRMFGQVSIALQSTDVIRQWTALPARPEIGRIYFFSNAVAAEPVIDAEGFYGYKSSGYVKMG